MDKKPNHDEWVELCRELIELHSSRLKKFESINELELALIERGAINSLETLLEVMNDTKK